jgi:3-dehydroquinate dehydratase/shikimate dehydrogenase
LRSLFSQPVEEAFLFLADITARLCVTVTAPTTAELRKRRDAVVDADLVELRLDSVSDPNVAGALAGRRLPTIVTCRPAWEGGQFRGSEEERKRLLIEAFTLGADYVDVEWRAHFDDLIAREAGRRIVLSAHDFDMLPIDLLARVHAMKSTGAEVVKLAVKTTRLTDCLPLLDIASQGHRHGGLVIVGMGEHGLATRVLASRFGSMWTYAGSQADIGQLSPERLLDEYQFRSLTRTTEVYGIVGRPVAHSASPAMHNAAFRAARLDAVYLPLPAVDVDDFVEFARALGIKGASVTIPYKIALYERVDEAYAVARRIGAINTIRVEDGRWIGGNTDASAFLAPLSRRVPLTGTRVAVLGAGGASRAVAVALASSGAQVCIHARNLAQAQDVAMLTSACAGPWPPAPDSWDLLINCTPVGMHPRVNETPLDGAALTGRCVYDLIYNPPVTRLLREAATAGCHTIGGLEMLVAQAHEQFQWWTDVRPAAGVMREAALKRLAEFIRDEDHVV